MESSRGDAAVSRLSALVAAAACCASLTGCIDFLDSGEMGTPRYFGEVRGDAPLNLIPPISDRDGNVYVLYGAADLNEVEAFVGHAEGGWSAGCMIHKGDDRGAHGWLGRAQDRAWYWSGDGVVEVSGRTGSCTAVLDVDPISGANLQFQGAVPMVKETPSRTYMLALIQTAADARPFHVVVDLDLKRYSNVIPFEPTDATNVVVLGTGADRDSETGFMIVQYTRGGVTVVEAIYENLDGDIIGRSTLTGLDGSAEDSVLGYLQSEDGQSVVGLMETGEVVAFNRSGGGTRGGPGFTPVGVHKWDGKLWMVGLGGSTPQVGRIDRAGNVGAGVNWNASMRASMGLAGSVGVLDDRSDPRRTVGWSSPVSAIGSQPFLSPFSLDVYATDTTGWLLAGPSFTAGGESQTSVAFVPIGVSYP